MSQVPPEQRTIRDPQSSVAGPDEPVRPTNGSALPPAPPVQTEHAVDSTAGVVKRERVVKDDEGLAHSERTVHDVAGEQRLALDRTIQVIWLFFGIVEGLIGLRIVLKLIGSNPDNAFARFVYSASDLFVGPFVTLTGSPSSGGMTLEIPSIIAMAVYALLGWVLVRIARVLWPMFSRSTTSSTSTYDRYRS
jgi:YggT family protein